MRLRESFGSVSRIEKARKLSRKDFSKIKFRLWLQSRRLKGRESTVFLFVFCVLICLNCLDCGRI